MQPLDYHARRHALTALRQAVLRHQDALLAALAADLGKSATEAYMCEVGLLLDDIGYTLRHLRRWMRPHRVPAPLSSFPATSRVMSEPYGRVLVMAPWNYPVLLSLQPLAGAVAAGNSVVLKPSELAPASAAAIEAVVADMAKECPCVSVVQGGADTASALLEEQWDYIFYTGNPNVGRIVMQAAARHLTPVTLELGGKSPVIVDSTAHLPLAARRIAFGKFLNAGQTCVAPDYVLVHRDVHDRFVTQLKAEIQRQFPDGCGRIINDRHRQRLAALSGAALGDVEKPLVLDGIDATHPAMQEEIFGPILPVLTVDNVQQAIDFVNARPKPLALYLFTTDRHVRQRVLGECSFGGGCVNDTIMHLSQHNLPFGGVGESGIGAYHGRLTFDTFSHQKSIVDRGLWLDPSMRYRPYTEAKLKLIRRFLG